MKVIVFYGTDCNEKSAWIPWLKENCERGGGNIDCIIPNLPTPENQTYSSWKEIADGILIDKDDVIVGWSTGAIFAVRYLFEQKIKVSKLILISGFNNYIGNVPFVDNINKNFFMESIIPARNIAEKIICIKSDDDPFISQQALNDFANDLNGEIVNIKKGGHFNDRAGYKEFPELFNLILV